MEYMQKRSHRNGCVVYSEIIPLSLCEAKFHCEAISPVRKDGFN